MNIIQLKVIRYKYVYFVCVHIYSIIHIIYNFLTEHMQVTTVTFQDLPGCNLSTLSQCPKLQFLSLRRCGLIALEGLTNCKDLKYIDVEVPNILVSILKCSNIVIILFM